MPRNSTLYPKKNYVLKVRMSDGSKDILCYIVRNEKAAKDAALNKNNVDKILECIQVSDHMYQEFLKICQHSKLARRK